jgi:hypothetical protein
MASAVAAEPATSPLPRPRAASAPPRAPQPTAEPAAAPTPTAEPAAIAAVEPGTVNLSGPVPLPRRKPQLARVQLPRLVPMPRPSPRTAAAGPVQPQTAPNFFNRYENRSGPELPDDLPN